MKATCIVMFLFLLSPSLFSGLADSSHFKGFDAEDEPLGVNSLHRLTDLPHLNKPTTTRLSDPQPQTPDDLPHLNKPTTTRLSDPQPQTPDDLPHLNKPTTTRLSDTQPETPEPKSDANPDPKPTRQPNPISKKPSSYLIEFATKDSIFEKNFSLPGVGGGEDSPLLLKDGQNVFKFYSSGRRFCSVLPATMELVYMNGDTMGHVVFASAMKKAAKGMQKETRDLNRLAEMVPAPTGSSRWAVDELGVIKEVFGEKAFEKYGKGFISIDCSDQHPSIHNKVLMFKFALFDTNKKVDMTRLVALALYYINLIGLYKLSPQKKQTISRKWESVLISSVEMDDTECRQCHANPCECSYAKIEE